MGGETGPDLTESKLVLSDQTGEKIAAVIREGRPDNKMPGFNFSSQEMQSIIAFIRARETAAKTHPGGRRGVSIEDLQTGNAQAGKQYFEGAGGCTKCHSADRRPRRPGESRQGSATGTAHALPAQRKEHRYGNPANR